MRSKVLEGLKAVYLDNLRSEVFAKHRDLINEENKTSVAILLVFCLLILAVNLVVVPLMGRSATAQVVELGIYLVISVVAYALIRRGKSNYTALVYLIELPLLIISLLSGTVLEPGYPSFTFLFFLLVLPAIVIDKPWRLLGFIWCFGVVFCIVAVAVKPEDIAQRDVLHALNACLISSALCLCLVSARVKNIDFAAQFREQTLLDPLTGLYNRNGAEARVDASEPGALLFIDLDNFKLVNDTFGHAEGDRVLCAVGEALRRSFREDDVIVRVGGDEFAVFARGTWDEDELAARAQQTLDQIEGIEAGGGADGAHSDGAHADGEPFALSASLGCVVDARGVESFDELVRMADKEMYRVKTSGKAGFRINRLD